MSTPDPVHTGASQAQVGRSVPRLESHAKVTGQAEYIYNLRLPGMLHARMVRSTVAHGRILSIDTEAAAATPAQRQPRSRPSHGASRRRAAAAPCLCGTHRRQSVRSGPSSAIQCPVFSKVLIANRGEIAVRVIRACRELGIGSVAVYSDEDRSAMHVRLADEAYAIGGSAAADSYLRTEAIIGAVERSGADAVHPGYGFFSENADFARAIAASGVAFIGPPPAAIEVMGDKISARGAAVSAGVAPVPGTTETVLDPSQVEAFGAAHGWPVAVKAAYGGGGRGMKVIASADGGRPLRSASRRGRPGGGWRAFGRDPAVYIEKLPGVTPGTWRSRCSATSSRQRRAPRSTRDCTTQRRHQKLIEEAPAPAIDDALLAAMGDAAVAVAVGCGYVNAGTVEFLYAEGGFYYLEMNTRLQVEHPVTEMVTGIDLVEQQLRVAAGEPLPFTQDDITLDGCAIEVRVNAEDPAEGAFLPCPGPITSLRAAHGFGTRWDGGYEAGDTVSPYYDNLIGKLVVWGRDRDVAIGRALSALSETAVTGVATTVGAAQAIISHPDFAAVGHSTRWVADTLDLTGVSGVPTAAPEAAAGAAVRRDVDVEVDGKRFNVALWAPSDAGDSAGPAGAGRRRSSGPASLGGGANEVTVPMQGTVVKLLVQPGDEVEAGDAVAVLEAMKMENNIAAGRSGTVTEVRVEVGDSVGGGDTIAIIE